jgi:hypothetical protein
MTEAAKTTTTKKPTTAKAETAPKPAPKVEAKDRPAPVQTSNLMENLFFGGMTVAFFAIFASIIFYTVG